MAKKNNIVDIQDMLMKQMHRLDEAVAKEIPTEVNRSGALSQNAQAFLKSVSVVLKVKEMSKRNPATEMELMEETGIIEE